MPSMHIFIFYFIDKMLLTRHARCRRLYAEINAIISRIEAALPRVTIFERTRIN